MVDGLVKGMDRKPTELMDELVTLDCNKMPKRNSSPGFGRASVRRSDFDSGLVSLGVTRRSLLLSGGISAMLIVRGICGAVANRDRDGSTQIMRGDYHVHDRYRDAGQQRDRSHAERDEAMETRLGLRCDRSQAHADANLRIKIGLDNVSTGVMISDIDHKIIYMNRADGRADARCRSRYPQGAAGLQCGRGCWVAASMIFHKNAGTPDVMLERLSTARIAPKSASAGARLRWRPARSSMKRGHSSASCWNGRIGPPRVAVENEVADIVDGCGAGRLHGSVIDMQGKEGFFLQLSAGINRLMETADHGLQEVVRMLGALSRGDLTDHITNEYQAARSAS